MGKKEAGLIYGTLKSKISFGGNANFYRNTKLEQNNYPDINKKGENKYLPVEFEDIGA